MEKPGRSTPFRFVVQLWPGWIGSAAVNVPVVTISPDCSSEGPGWFAMTLIKWATAFIGLPKTFEPFPRSSTFPLHDKVISKFWRSEITPGINLLTSFGSPKISFACSPEFAIVSADWNFQPGKWDWTISIPWAIQSIHLRISSGLAPFFGGE